MARVLTTYGYAELHGLTVDTVRRHCRNGTLKSTWLPSSGHGTYLIDEYAEIIRKKRGRKPGSKNRKD